MAGWQRSKPSRAGELAGQPFKPSAKPRPLLTEGDLAVPNQLLQVGLLRFLGLRIKDDSFARRRVALLHPPSVPGAVVGPQHIHL